MATSDSKRYRDYEGFYLQGQVRDGGLYRKHARNYARQFGALLAGSRERSILDVGCANGLLAGYLKGEGFAEVVGVDVNEALAAQAREHVDGEFVAGDALAFLQGGRRFDIIFLLNVVEHIERDGLVAFMEAVRGALKEGGFAVVRTPNMSHVMAAGHLADDLTHCTGLTEQSLRQLAEAAGFGRVERLNQWRMQNFKGKVKAVLSALLHRFLWWVRGGTRPRVVYRNLYAQLFK